MGQFCCTLDLRFKCMSQRKDKCVSIILASRLVVPQFKDDFSVKVYDFAIALRMLLFFIVFAPNSVETAANKHVCEL